jgi:hypothetical protein
MVPKSKVLLSIIPEQGARPGPSIGEDQNAIVFVEIVGTTATWRFGSTHLVAVRRE